VIVPNSVKYASKRVSKRSGGADLSIHAKFSRLGLASPEAFVLHLPIRYEDETQIQEIAYLRPGMSAQVEGEVVRSDIVLKPRRQLTATIKDDSAEIALRWLTFYPSQLSQMQTGKRWRVRGEVRGGMYGFEIIHPRISIPGAPLSAALTPVYPTTEGLSQPSLRKAITQALGSTNLQDTLPETLVKQLELMSFEQAIRTLHGPTPDMDAQALMEHTHPAWIRIKFDELLAQQLSLAAARTARQNKRAHAFPMRESPLSLSSKLKASLPFSLTAAQVRVSEEIAADLDRTYPMYRLLQGDVGSGKTIVAALAALQAIDHGAQVALMAPTEILAEQHYVKLKSWCEPLGIKVTWLAGSVTAKARREALQDIGSGQAKLIVGTQALIQEGVDFHSLGLIIVDEQHRFGVAQRLTLSRKGEDDIEFVPHQLTMSATPIPRTLAMTFYADLEVSSIDELPPGRTPVITKLIAADRRGELIEHVAQAVAKGQQTYWVCPLVEESEALDLQTAVDTHRDLSEALVGLNVGLVHGRLPTAEKAQVMQAFRSGDINVLVATTVIEVGVDVPNASLMVIEHAERFGLAQLHQLRGRVGRGALQSVCVLLYQTPLSMIARQRLRAMYETQDGFEIAQRDLDLRGPGELLGARQSGVSLLRFADLATDSALVRKARDVATDLRKNSPEVVQRHLSRWMRGREDYLRG
jgi:ATP-dependent DNA helicase RecG